jgi:hypothetical protein
MRVHIIDGISLLMQKMSKKLDHNEKGVIRHKGEDNYHSLYINNILRSY